MKNICNVLLQIVLTIIIGIGINNVVPAQDYGKDTIPARIIELTQGCKLVLDAKINVTDSVSSEIIDGIRSILPQVQKLIPADSATIKLAISSVNILPVWGIGARTISGFTDHHREETVEIYYDPNNSNFRVELILRTLVHELHHVCRVRMPDFQLTLLECMVNEGLADHFMLEVLNCEITPFSSALTEEQIQQNMIRIKPFCRAKFESWTKEFNDNYFVPWMFGRKGDDPIPHWTGYSIGWKIVENYLRAHPQARASSLVFTSPEVIASSTPELKN
jgi:hypothetical protein